MYLGFCQVPSLPVGDDNPINQLTLSHDGNIDAVGSCYCHKRHPPPDNCWSSLARAHRHRETRYQAQLHHGSMYLHHKVHPCSSCHSTTGGPHIRHCYLTSSHFRLSIAVGVVDNCIEGLIEPLAQDNIDEPPMYIGRQDVKIR